MTDQVAEIDPFAPGTLDQKTELAALIHALEFASGFSLLFVVCNQAPQRRQLMAKMREQLPKFKVQEIIFNEPVNHLLDALCERLIEPLPNAIFVSGLEHSLPTLTGASTTTFIANLNASRNSFPQTMPRPLVLWVPEYVLTAIVQGAPDFFSIRSGVYAFAATPEELTEFARILFAGDHWQAESLPLPEKQHRLAAIRGLLAEYEALPVERQDRRTQMRLLDRLGVLLSAQGNYTEALRQFQQAVRLAEGLGDRASVASLLHRLGMRYQAIGEHDKALQCYKQSLRIAEEQGDRSLVAPSLHQLGTLYQALGEYDQALQYYDKSLRILEELNDRLGIANSLGQVGILHHAQGAYREALSNYEQALRIFEELGDRTGLIITLHQLGILHQLRGEHSEALRHYEESMRIAEELGDRAQVARSLHQLGNLYYLQGAYDEALQRYEQSLRIKKELGDRAGVATSLHQLGILHQARSKYDEALQFYEQSLRIREELNNRAGVASSRGQIGILLMETARYGEAFAVLLNALAISIELQSPDAKIIANTLRALRARWSKQAFDTAWREATGEDVPDWLKESSKAAS